MIRQQSDERLTDRAGGAENGDTMALAVVVVTTWGVPPAEVTVRT